MLEKVALNKSSLKKIKDQKSLYEKYLPTLELKKKQLQMEVKKAENELLDKYREIAEYKRTVAEWASLLIIDSAELNDIIEITNVEISIYNQVGVKVPQLDKVEFKVKPYSFLATLPWVDELVLAMKKILTLEIEEELKRRKMQMIQNELKKITQRINLFEKVMIPRCEENIRKIKVFLGDSETAAVCRSKIAKSKLAQSR